MKLIQANIIEFAAMHDRVFDFGAGMNIIEGKNESGKSTLLAFIRFMLYGFSGRATQNGEPCERDRYLNWSSRRAAGTLTLEANGHIFRIEREGHISQTTRGESYIEKPVQIIDAETGTLVHKGKCPGELFLGMNAAVFSATCSVAQLSAQSINSTELGNAIENMLQSADESINVTKVCRRLDDARKELIYKNGRGGKIYDLQCEAENLASQLERAENNAKTIMELETEALRCRQATAEAFSKQNKLSELWEKSEAWLILGRFEQSVKLSDEIAQLDGQLSELRRNSFEGGFMPEVSYVSELKALSSELSAAQDAASDAELKRRRHESILTYDTQKADIAQQLLDGGHSKNSIVNRYLALKKSVSNAQMFGLMALICGAIAIAGGVVSALVSTELMILGIALSALGAVGIIAGALLLGSTKKKNAAVLALLSEIQLDSDMGEDDLARYIDDCLNAYTNKKNYIAALSALTQVAENCRENVKRIVKAAHATLKKAGIVSDVTADATVTALRSTALKCEEFISAQAALCRRIDSARAEKTRLDESLSSYDEAFIRARASKLDRKDAISSAEHTQLRDRFAAEVREAYDRQTAVERQIAYYEGQETSPARISSRLELCRAEEKRLTRRAEALILAREAIESASGKLRRGFTPTLRSEAGKLLSPLTAERYTELGISDEFALSLVADGSTRSISYMSGGTRDASYLALRLALTKLLCTKERPPVLLDEALSQLDDSRAEGLLGMLSQWCSDGNQCLLFTCHTRESGLAQNYTHIKL